MMHTFFLRPLLVKISEAQQKAAAWNPQAAAKVPEAIPKTAGANLYQTPAWRPLQASQRAVS